MKCFMVLHLKYREDQSIEEGKRNTKNIASSTFGFNYDFYFYWEISYHIREFNLIR